MFKYSIIEDGNVIAEDISGKEVTNMIGMPYKIIGSYVKSNKKYLKRYQVVLNVDDVIRKINKLYKKMKKEKGNNYQIHFVLDRREDY